MKVENDSSIKQNIGEKGKPKFNFKFAQKPPIWASKGSLRQIWKEQRDVDRFVWFIRNLLIKRRQKFPSIQ